MSNCELDDVQDFLTTTVKQGYQNDNTAQGRKTALAKLMEVMDDGQKTIDYVVNNIDSIKTRFQNLNKEMRGGTVDIYAKRTLLAVNDYVKWRADRALWERQAGMKGTRSSDDDKKPKVSRAENVKAQAATNVAPTLKEGTRMVAIPIRDGFDVSIVVPKDLKKSEVRKLAYILLGYANDFDPSAPIQNVQSFLDFKEGSTGMNG